MKVEMSSTVMPVSLIEASKLRSGTDMDRSGMPAFIGEPDTMPFRLTELCDMGIIFERLAELDNWGTLSRAVVNSFNDSISGDDNIDD